MKRSEVRQVTIVTEACTEGPFQHATPIPKSFKDDTAVEIPRSEGVSLKAFYAKPGGLQSKLDAGLHCFSRRIRPKESVPVVTARPARHVGRARATPEVSETRVGLGRVDGREIASGAAEKVR
jgi:hypothetical protein